MAKLTFKLVDKNGGPCDFADLSDFQARLCEVLRRVFRAEAPGKGELPRYRVTRLEVGSALATLSATPNGAPVIYNFVESVKAIRQKMRPSVSFTGDDIRAFRHLTDTLDSHTKQIELNEDLLVDERFREGCDYLLASAPKSFGQAIGRLEGMNIHSKKFFRIYPEGMDRGAECYFTEDQYELVHANMGHRVRVEGLIHRDPDGTGIDRISQIRIIEKIPEASELPSLSSLMGLFKDNPIDLCRGWQE